MPPETNPIGKGYALWLTPGEPMFSRLAREISRLSRQLSTPRFEPHVTLLSRIMLPEKKALGRSAKLSHCLRPFRTELADIDGLDEFFRCLFVTVRAAEPILSAHQAACRVFARQWVPYTPHLSLVYGKLPADRRKKIARGLSLLAGQVLDVRKMGLYRVSGPVRQWKCIETFDLK